MATGIASERMPEIKDQRKIITNSKPSRNLSVTRGAANPAGKMKSALKELLAQQLK